MSNADDANFRAHQIRFRKSPPKGWRTDTRATITGAAIARWKTINHLLFLAQYATPANAKILRQEAAALERIDTGSAVLGRSRPPEKELFDSGLSLADKKDVVIAALKSKAPDAEALCKALFDQLVESETGMHLDLIEVGGIVEWEKLEGDEEPEFGIRHKIRVELENSERNYCLLDLRGSKGHRAYLVGLMSGFEEPNWSYVGIFLSRRKAMAAVRRDGVISFGQRPRL